LIGDEPEILPDRLRRENEQWDALQRKKGLTREFYVDFSLFICDVSNGRSAGVQKRSGVKT